VRHEYGIKSQAYNLLDTINTDYLEENTKLKGENLRLLEENNKVKQELELLKKQIQLKPHVVPSIIKDKCFDLTSEDDDEIQVVAGGSSVPPEVAKQIPASVIEINDEEEEDDDVLFVTTAIDTTEINTAEPEVTTPEFKAENSNETEDERAAKRKSFDPCCSTTILKKPRHDLDLEYLEDYILSQI
jgi:hypothetical protein